MGQIARRGAVEEGPMMWRLSLMAWRAVLGRALGTRSDRQVLPLLQAQVARPLVITEGVLFPSILAPRDGVHDGVPDGNVQAIFSLRLIAAPAPQAGGRVCRSSPAPIRQ